MHYHGYRFRGKESRFDPNAWKGTVGFETTDTAPDRLCWALLKPVRMIEGTWDDPEEALAWYLTEYDHCGPEARNREEELRFFNPDRRPQDELASLREGGDVCRSMWLNSGERVAIWVVCCPNAWETNPCPLGRTDTRPEGATKGGN